MGAAGSAAVLQLTPRVIEISPQSHSSFTILQLSDCCKPNTESCTIGPLCSYGPKYLNERVGKIAQLANSHLCGQLSSAWIVTLSARPAPTLVWVGLPPAVVPEYTSNGAVSKARCGEDQMRGTISSSTIALMQYKPHDVPFFVPNCFYYKLLLFVSVIFP